MVGVMLTVVLVLGLVTHPGPTTNVLWNAIIPVLPAVFLLSPALWRNVCPLSTLATLSPLRYRTRTIDAPMVRATLVVGVILLFVLVPARRFWFNTDGGALAVAIIMVAILALASGFAFKRKAGFCNAICPVLPVERLYGQRPLVTVPNVRCTPCVGCTERGCIDLSPADSARSAMGPRGASRRSGPGRSPCLPSRPTGRGTSRRWRCIAWGPTIPCSPPPSRTPRAFGPNRRAPPSPRMQPPP